MISALTLVTNLRKGNKLGVVVFGVPDGECDTMISALTLVTNLRKGNKLVVLVKGTRWRV